ncbi:hypothetical protein [Tenacibaculum finnmarkense]|uniref:hypothetical protein n=1 Tax=Tenacibaculum finnmarkense TaxID=2781243 RepID=UPI002300CB84|nr:hypothetical protein [Tenacibaculum finnmarkense]WCC46586.1 hypothetical protein PJH08_09395 [Tenacibaculum finnmarkense]
MKTYKLKVPVYISTEKKDESTTITFKELVFSKDLLINNLIDKINVFNKEKKPITKDKRNKSITQNIEKVAFEKISFGNDSGLLLRVTSFITNHFDGYVETIEKVKLKKTDKIGSKNYIFILYPHTFGVNKLQFKWIIFLYEDPNKNNSEIVNASKMVLKEILDIEIKNIKLNDIISRFKKNKIIPELSLKLSSFEFDENDEDYHFHEYVTESKSSKIKETVYKDIPLDKVKKIIEDTKIFKFFSKRSLKITNGKQQFKIEQNSIDEVIEKINEVAEESYNFSTEITSNEIENDEIYKTSFIIKKLQPVIENFLGYNDDL